jgi:uncharacterized protein (TIGR02598 family)
MRPAFPPPEAKAFSLIEVMLALAIASVGFVTMLGLLPHGLHLVQTSAEMSAEARIKQKLSGELLLASWDELTWNGYGPTRYFNDQGIELVQSEVEGGKAIDSGLTYVASVQMPAEALDLRLPFGGQDGAVENYMRRARICIATTTDPQFDFGAVPKQRVRSYTAIVAKM